MLKIAITGNIASGKSQVEKYLREKGFKVFDTDEIAHKVLDTITEFYDYDVFTHGKIDRQKLGKIVFSDGTAKKQLENIVHPKVKENIMKIFEKYKNEKYIFVSVPLLFEANFTDIFDKIVFISCQKNIRIERLMQRNSLTKDDAILRVNSQQDEEFKIKHSDYIIKNESTLDNLKLQLDKFCKQL